MTQNETIAALAVVAVVAFVLGGQYAMKKAATVQASADPLAWLNWNNPTFSV
jgi:hypothetical protein